MADYKLIQKNKKAFFNFEIVESLECGIELEGTEVKSIRLGKFSFGDAYVRIRNGELFLIGLHISTYDFGNINNHEPVRDRRLLVKKQEIKKYRRKVEEKGFSIMPLKIYIRKNLIKVEIGLGRGKKLHDKRDSIRDRDLKRDAQRQIKQNY
ncbi:MAG: SsrA-binding protein SmpB [Spirochaetia bacterium]|nr:SsrA-binding protein SmpB [Spirochaetia bacterium]